MAGQRVLGIVLAGAAGKRLAPLTEDRAKSAVPFGGLYRLVDFALSNLANGGIYRICVLTQYKSHSLDRHITTTWRLNSLLGNYVTPVPAQQRRGPHWQTGSADAIYQSLNLIYDDRPDLVVVFGADHVYRMDPAQMIEAHTAWGAGVTVAAIPESRGRRRRTSAWCRPRRTATASRRSWKSPPTRLHLRGSPDEAFASMGNYVFDRDVLVEALRKDAADVAASTASAATSSRGWPRTAPRTSTTSCRTRCPAPTGATTATGGRSGRSTPISTRTWTCARCTRCSTSTTTSGRS